ncbi:hypothetical protein THMIRHAM_09110 [Thiomicrorhabdus immobilis]|uniref:TMEM205-like domain-containing protein n=1 Tax=Thiomicrorhabdus immobilis TaxID=2791037 RepID=A0ABN6CVS5_9GAMM|nr:DUF4149 domain-containing protein [Thiomicrorhabdus immobilis]BCN93126.1 hypothetical protein THMIRHAM_09110 [Thiomicrorhabdus immobilis]
MSKLRFIRSISSYYSTSLIIYSALISLLLTIGYLVTPVLFASLSAKLAGFIAGLLFNISGYLLLLFLLLLLAWRMSVRRVAISIWFDAISLFLMTGLLWVVSPWMTEIKAKYPQGIEKNAVDWPLFASLHGVYQVGYLIVIIMLIVAMFKTVKCIKSTQAK